MVARFPSFTKSVLPPSFIFAVIFFAALFMLGFPPPDIDDLFFIGAGLNLAAGGGLVNPLLARQNFPGAHFFEQPPAHSYAVAGWVKMFGVSAASLMSFQTCVYLVIAWSTIRLLRHWNAPVALEWLVPFAVTASFLAVGLRPEPLSVALGMAGFVLAVASGGGIRAFTGFFLIFLSGSVASRVAFYSGALALAALFQICRDRKSFVRMTGTAGLALFAVIALFGLMIGFHFEEFYRVYHYHAAGRIGGDRLQQLRIYFHGLPVTHWPLFGAWLIALPFFLAKTGWKQKGLPLVVVSLSATVLALAVIGAMGHGTVWYVTLALFLLLAVLVPRSKTWYLMVAEAALAGLLLVANARIIIPLIGTATGSIKTATSGNRELLDQAVKAMPEHPLLVDFEAARFAFDYRIPSGAIDFNFAAPFPGFNATETSLRPGDNYVIGSMCVGTLARKTGAIQPVPEWAPLSLKRWACYEYPRRYYVIPAKDCMNIASNAPPMGLEKY